MASDASLCCAVLAMRTFRTPTGLQLSGKSEDVVTLELHGIHSDARNIRELAYGSENMKTTHATWEHFLSLGVAR